MSRNYTLDENTYPQFLCDNDEGSGEQAEQGVGIQLVSEGKEIVAEDVAPLQPRRQKKRKSVVVDAGELSHLVKRLRDDHGIPGGTSAEVDSFARPFVPVIIAATTITPTAGPTTVVKEKIVKPSLFFVDSASTGTDPATGGFADLSGSDFLVGGIRAVI
nr:hypothetical protein [Tanacetum cinerariifolium]